MDTKRRYYQIDILKLLCALLVFFCHTRGFINSNDILSYQTYFENLGGISVHFFFIISGFLMVRSLDKKDYDGQNAGKYSFDFVINKFKKIGLYYIVALLMILFMQYIYIYTKIDTVATQTVFTMQPFDLTIRAIPELFGLTQAGVLFSYNAPVWYISAMLFAMLPLGYLLIKNRDFFIYVFSPFAALILFGFMFQKNDAGLFLSHEVRYGICLGGIIMAICGICFGAVSWILNEKFSNMMDTKLNKILITVVEIGMEVIFFYTWLFRESTKDTLYPLMLLMPIIIAIIFSRKSYISRMFCCKWMGCLSKISELIFLNHYAAMYVVTALFAERGYWFNVSLMAFFTAVFCLINIIVVNVIKSLWKRAGNVESGVGKIGRK